MAKLSTHQIALKQLKLNVKTFYLFTRIVLTYKELKELKSSYLLSHSKYTCTYWKYWDYNLLSNVAKMENVVYCDTDSIYFIDSEKNRSIVSEYNEKLLNKNKTLFKNKNLLDLGLFDYQPTAMQFKTLGCKRYIYTYEKNNEIKLKQTIAGLPKKTLENWKVVD